MKLRKTTATLLIAIFMISTLAFVIPAIAKKDDGVRIKDGILTYSADHYLEGEPLILGYDPYGYNYQAHLYNGYYCNVYLGRDSLPPYEGDAEAYLAENPTAEGHWTWPHRDIMLNMKWNDAWLSNMDRGFYDTDAEQWVLEPDGVLDRWYGYDSYIGSGAWETNHQWGINDDETHWNYFCKIVAAYSDWTCVDEYWFDDDVEIGEEIWGSFAIIFQVSNDPVLDEHGVLYNPPGPTGFGYYMP